MSAEGRAWTRNDRADHDAGHPGLVDCDGDALGPGEACGNRFPATPDTGAASEVEALAEAVWNAMPAHHVGWRGLKGDQRAFYIDFAERLMPHVAAREAAARAEERERIAQAIETDANTPPKGSLNHRAYAGHFAALVRRQS